MPNKADLGVIGLGVMGQNLALNIEDHDYKVAVYNKEPEMTDAFMQNEAAGKNFIATKTLEDFISSLSSPKKILLMITAGSPVDSVIHSLLPLLQTGDSIIDSGNSNFIDTRRNFNELEEKGILFLGMGISGGADGARNGPCLMAGGSKKAYEMWEDILLAISAKAGGTPCCAYLGEGGSGHFVKMTHNGIEYADMQLICEAYSIMRDVLHLSHNEMSDIFRRWNRGKLNGYLTEITANILSYRDVDGGFLIDKIDDVVNQKGTGKWTVESAMDEGVPMALISAAVFARNISTQKTERETAAHFFSDITTPIDPKRNQRIIDQLEKALYLSKIVAYAQGFDLLKTYSDKHSLHLPLSTVASIWQGGCIIRSAFLTQIETAYEENPNLSNLLFDPALKDEVSENMQSLRDICILAIEKHTPLPCQNEALSYLDLFSANRLPTNLLAAQRDYFGSHTYHKIGEKLPFHTDWKSKN